MQITPKQCQEKDADTDTDTAAQTQQHRHSSTDTAAQIQQHRQAAGVTVRQAKKRVLTFGSQLIHGGRRRNAARELIVAEQDHLQVAAVLQQRHGTCQLVARHIQDFEAD